MRVETGKSIKQKEDQRKVHKKCAVCGAVITVWVEQGGRYKGGHYFGKIPLYTKAEMERANRMGTRVVRMQGIKLNVLISDPKPYRFAEYWECQRCFAP